MLFSKYPTRLHRSEGKRKRYGLCDGSALGLSPFEKVAPKTVNENVF